MVKFNVSSGVPSTTAGAPTPAAEVSLAEVASMDPVPIHPIWTPARVHWVFGTQSKYPQFKVILCAPGSNPGETGGQGGSVCEACGCGREADLEEKQWERSSKVPSALVWPIANLRWICFCLGSGSGKEPSALMCFNRGQGLRLQVPRRKFVSFFFGGG